jgi:hypothetical protein
MKKLLLILALLFPMATFAYPWCGPDIILGGQIWAPCNSMTKGKWGFERSGWFFAGEKFPVYSSYNEWNDLTPETRNRAKDTKIWPCAKGYRIPTRGEWETALWYARLNNTNISLLLSLPRNGGYEVYRDRDEIVPVSRKNTLGSYWSSTIEDIYGNQPIILHMRSPLSQNSIDTTDPAGVQPDFLTPGTSLIANVRCIRN